MLHLPLDIFVALCNSKYSKIICNFAPVCVAAYMCGNLCISPTSLDAIVGFELAAAASSSDDGLGRHLLSVRNGSVLILWFSM